MPEATPPDEGSEMEIVTSGNLSESAYNTTTMNALFDNKDRSNKFDENHEGER